MAGHKRYSTPKVVASEIYYALIAVFKKKGIQIPFPQRDIHLWSAETIPISTTR